VAADETPADADEGAEPSATGTGTATAGAAYGGGQLATLVGRDDVLRESRDRQVLIVGDTTVGRVLTGLLRRAGYGPVLAATRAGSVEPAVGIVDAGAFDVLAAAGVADRVRERGTGIAAVDSTWPREDGGEPASSLVRLPPDRARPVAIETATIRRLVDAEYGTPRAATDRTVDGIARAEDGVEVAFENGVREWFDVVVDVAGAGLSRGTSAPCRETASLRQYETRLAARPDAAPRLRDVWTEDGLVQLVPVHDGTATLLRVTTHASERCQGLPAVAVGDRLPEDVAGLSSALADVEPSEVSQRRPDADGALPGAWGRGRVMRCGVAASPMAPATGLALSRGIADAAAVVTALTRSRGSIEATVDAYATDRERATATARPERPLGDVDDATPGGSSSAVADDGLRALAIDRRTALAAIRASSRPTE